MASRQRFEDRLKQLGSEKRIRYDLDRFRKALQALGHPERDVKTLVIAGTNGKGSTSLFLSSILAQAGHQVLTYLSPHLQHVSERFLNQLHPEREDCLEFLAEPLWAIAEQFHLSYFEFLTLLAFVWARSQSPDFLVLEVGLGGRLDATNVTDPIATVLTNVSYDHQEYLGQTLPEILTEKLGVLRPESLLFTGVQEISLRRQLEKACDSLDAIYYYSHELPLSLGASDFQGQEVRIHAHPFALQTASVGAVQSALLAYLTTRIAFPKISIETIRQGLASVRNPGRLELVSQNPTVLLSGDHNPAGIDCLVQSLQRMRTGPVKILAGFSPDKPHAEMVEKLRKLSNHIVLTSIPSIYGESSPPYAGLDVFEPDPHRALDRILATETELPLIVTGSLYLVGELRKRWHAKVRFVEELPTALRPFDPALDESNRARFPSTALKQIPSAEALDAGL